LLEIVVFALETCLRWHVRRILLDVVDYEFIFVVCVLMSVTNVARVQLIRSNLFRLHPVLLATSELYLILLG